MKKYNINKICEIFKFIFINLIVYGIIIGVICGLIVTFLFYTPKISLTSTFVTNKDDKIIFEFRYENKGESPAVNIEYVKKYAIIYKNEKIYNDVRKRKYISHEVGDIVMDMLTVDPKIVGEDLFENSDIIMLCEVKYEDSSKIRSFVNDKLLNYHYKIYRLAFYDISKKEKCLSLLPDEKRNEYAEMINKWTNE